MLEKIIAPSVPLEAYGCVFIIETTYPEAYVACIGEEKKEEKTPWPSFQWQATSLTPAKRHVLRFQGTLCLLRQPAIQGLYVCPEGWAGGVSFFNVQKFLQTVTGH